MSHKLDGVRKSLIYTSPMYSDRVSKVLNPAEIRLFRRLNSPIKIQNFLDTLSVNFEIDAETYMSPRRVLRHKTAHCLEGAVLAAAILAYHDHKPLLMDFQTAYDDEDHVIALFRENGLWGALSKTNHAQLRYRDAVYRTPRELAMSYFHEYFLFRNGKKTLRAYSAPFDLSRYEPSYWVVATDELQRLVDDLDSSRHFPAVSEKSIRALRRMTPFEIQSARPTEWPDPRTRNL